jgi:hypothetical protein
MPHQWWSRKGKTLAKSTAGAADKETGVPGEVAKKVEPGDAGDRAIPVSDAASAHSGEPERRVVQFHVSPSSPLGKLMRGVAAANSAEEVTDNAREAADTAVEYIGETQELAKEIRTDIGGWHENNLAEPPSSELQVTGLDIGGGLLNVVLQSFRAIGDVALKRYRGKAHRVEPIQARPAPNDSGPSSDTLPRSPGRLGVPAKDRGGKPVLLTTNRLASPRNTH